MDDDIREEVKKGLIARNQVVYGLDFIDRLAVASRGTILEDVMKDLLRAYKEELNKAELEVHRMIDEAKQKVREEESV